MAIIYKQNGGLNPVPFVGQKSGQASVFGCNEDFQTNMHSTYPYKHNRVSIGADDFGDGCICPTEDVLAVGDVVVLAEIPAGQTLKDVKWRIAASDPTFRFDLDVRKSAAILVADATAPLAIGAGGTVSDGFVSPNQFFSEFGLAACPGKDCYGETITPPPAGRDHGVLVMVVTAVPTGVPPSCSTVLKQFGTFKATFDLVVTDLR